MVRIASYNLLHGIDLSGLVEGARGGGAAGGGSAATSPRIDLGAAAEAIAALDADVVAVQEADRALPRSGGSHQVDELGALLGMHARFAPALLGSPDECWRAAPDHDPGGPAYGVGLLSRWPLATCTRVALPGGGDGRRSAIAPANSDDLPVGNKPGWPGYDREPRAGLRAVVDTDAGRLVVTTAHLSYLPWRGLSQLAALARAADGGGPAVLVGDLNLPVWPVRALLAGRWRHAGGAATYPAWRPRLQVDQLLVRGGVAISDITVAARTSSDHLPLVATLALPRREEADG
ncbi:hypothetical protein BH23ACT8_BH23ACT8_11780 [soil metagenome]